MNRVKVASIVVVLAVGIAVALSPAPGVASPAADVPTGLADAIHAQFGPGPIRLASSAIERPQLGIRAAVSSDGTTALVSAPGAGNNAGAVYVYHVADAGSWASSSTPTATLTSAAAGSHAAFGLRPILSADGTTAFVGAPLQGGGNGAVYVFHVASEDAWTSTSTPTATLTVGGSFVLGGSMSASPDGTTLVIGDPDYSNGLGGAYVFHASAEDAWVSSASPTATLSNAGESTNDGGVGGTVAISGDGTTALLSDDPSGNGAGGADLFHVASEDGWVSSSAPTAILSNANGHADDGLGESLALSGDGTTAFLGAYGVKKERGAVDVFHASAEDAWATTSTPAAILTDAGSAANDQLGGVVRAAADGTTVVATAVDAANGRGEADVFHASDEGAWASTTAPTAKLTDSAGKSGDLLGWGLGVSGDGTTVVVGAPGVRWGTGAADVFHVADESSWLTTSSPAARLTNSALPKPVCVVPRLVGAPLAFARVILFEQDCRLGKVKRVHAKKKLRGRIVSQSPKPRKHLRAGAKVSVKVGKR